MKAIENLEGSTMDIEIVNCNHGGYYSVVGLEPHRNLGSVQRIAPRKWLARKHGEYRQPNPPSFSTRRDAIAHLAGSAS